MKTMKTEALRTDHFSELGVSIKQIELRCTSCGDTFTTPTPWATGNFPRNWYECPRGCNKVKASKPLAAA
jgi:hypothetical protein